MTEKENLLRVYRHEEPGWVPLFSMMPPKPGDPPPTMIYACPAFMSEWQHDGGRDIWGVRYVGAESVNGATIPAPGEYMFEDICDWRDYVHKPDISGFDWEKIAADELKNIDRENTAVVLALNTLYFHALVGLMGFENAFYAMAEDPEEVEALFDYVGSFYEEVLEKCLPVYKPDAVAFIEDVASSKAPFMSPDMYRELLKPYYDRYLKPVRERGIIITHHNCGKCESLIDDWLDLGISVWDPAQTMNDLVGIKEKYGGKLTMCGCWDSTGPVSFDTATEDYVRSEVRRVIDTFAPGGGFCFTGSILVRPGDEKAAQRRAWIRDEYEKYGRTWYQKH